MPFRKSGPFIVVDVKVDGKPMTLLVDSGAAVSMAIKKGIRCKLFVKHRDGELSFYTIDDDASVAFIDPEIRIDGILGQDIMSKFSSVCIDFKNHILELEAK